MKKFKLIVVTSDNPASGQCHISDLIGRRFEVSSIDKDTGEVSIDAPEYGGRIILQPSEYEFVREYRNTNKNKNER